MPREEAQTSSDQVRWSTLGRTIHVPAATATLEHQSEVPSRPSHARLVGRPRVVASISQVPSGRSRRNSPSHRPPVASRWPVSRAGTTLVLFRTRTSRRLEEFGKLGKGTMLPASLLAVDHHQPRLVPWLDGCCAISSSGQVEIEFGGKHFEDSSSLPRDHWGFRARGATHQAVGLQF